jgi:indole-3-glycerol phosphate synthase
MKLTSAIKRAKRDKKVPLIAEVKVHSPKDGDLLRSREPARIVREYERAGACAISVVTEPEHFKGNLQILETVRKSTNLPILRKDFIQNISQVKETKRFGADAILIIASMLPRRQLALLNKFSHQSGLETVIEIHNKMDLKKIENLEVDIIGINNKDILDLERGKDQIKPTLELINRVPKHAIVISESGIRNLRDLKKVMTAGSDAVLIGTALLKAKDIGKKVRQTVMAKIQND